MKKKTIINFVGSTMVLSAIAVCAAVGISHFDGKLEQTKAYDTASLPTTIDLNDTAESTIREYYSSLNSLSEDERQGNNLLKNLKTILKKDQKYYSYDTDSNGKKIWQIYEIADRDWNKSPASEIEGYDASTNTITNYKYGESATKSGSNPYLHALYVDRSVDNKMRSWALEGTTNTNHGDNMKWGIDREHIWPKSLGFEEKKDEHFGAGGARGDLMHLWPGDSDVNSSLHSNNFYGYVNITNSTKAGKWDYAKNNYVGTSLTLGSGVDVFEPQDSDKGDIARAIFYMVARYNNLAGGDTIDLNNPNLELITDLSGFSTKGYVSTQTTTGKNGLLQDLLNWNHIDPVDEFEIHRNNLLYTNYTNNRNPFIDFPDWADYIWGTVEYNGRQYQSYNSKPSGAANPATDQISKSSNTPATPSEPEKKGFDIKKYWWVIVIAVVVVVAIIVLVCVGVVKVKVTKKGKVKVKVPGTTSKKSSSKKSSSSKKKK